MKHYLSKKLVNKGIKVMGVSLGAAFLLGSANLTLKQPQANASHVRYYRVAKRSQQYRAYRGFLYRNVQLTHKKFNLKNAKKAKFTAKKSAQIGNKRMTYVVGNNHKSGWINIKNLHLVRPTRKHAKKTHAKKVSHKAKRTNHTRHATKVSVEVDQLGSIYHPVNGKEYVYMRGLGDVIKAKDVFGYGGVKIYKYNQKGDNSIRHLVYENKKAKDHDHKSNEEHDEENQENQENNAINKQGYYIHGNKIHIEYGDNYDDFTLSDHTTDTMPVTNEYVHALTDFYNHGSNDDSAVKQAAKHISSPGFKVSMNDVKEKVNPTHLTASQQKELTNYTFNIINSIRQQFGTPNVTPTMGGQQFADLVAQRYNHDNWNLLNEDNHDVNGINEVANEYGLTSSGSYQAGQYYEDADIDNNIDSSKVPMASMKYEIYTQIFGMMFNDNGFGNNWEHSCDLSGVNSNDKIQYGGFSIDKYKGLHYENIQSSFVKDGSKLDGLTEPY